MDLFTHLGEDAMTGDEIGRRLGLHPRAIHDFLDKSKPSYVGGLLEMYDARLYGFWRLTSRATRLPSGGALIIIEALIDDARRENTFGPMMSLNMLIEFGDAFDFTGSDFASWCREAGSVTSKSCLSPDPTPLESPTSEFSEAVG
jgi:hypothetical protein